jgi:hypothetical protein
MYNMGTTDVKFGEEQSFMIGKTDTDVIDANDPY